jgi:hypothetical protein
MANNGYYKSRRTFEPGTELPEVSSDLDSVRAYQFEVIFKEIQLFNGNVVDLTLAAKRVSGLASRNEFITVDRVNDKLYYPGKTTNEDLQIEFDNLYLKDTAGDLYRYFKSIYDPITGEMTKDARPGGAGQLGTFKTNMIQVVELDNTMTPHATTNVYGAFPISWAASEFNYSTNDFHTLTMTLKYDFLDRPEAFYKKGNVALGQTNLPNI